MTLKQTPPQISDHPAKRPLPRRWDETGGAAQGYGGVLPMVKGDWLDLEDGVQVSFAGDAAYEPGDYWLFPSRALSEDIEWPQDGGGPAARPPNGVWHSYAPLAVVEVRDGTINVTELREKFGPINGYVRKTGDTISGDLTVEGKLAVGETLAVSGSLNVAGEVTVGLLTGRLGPGTVQTGQLVDQSVTFPKLAAEIATVPPGFAVLGATAQPPDFYRFTGSVLYVLSSDPTWAGRAQLPSQMTGHVSCAVLGGRFFVLLDGGEIWEYEPDLDQWTGRRELPARRWDFAVAAGPGRIHVLGGADDSGRTVGAHEAYDPATDTWERRADLPTPRRALAAAALSATVYATGGLRASGARSVHHEAYDAARDVWERRAFMPTPRSHLALAAAQGRLYAIGGRKDRLIRLFGNKATARNEGYLPSEDRWSTRFSPMPTPRSDLSIAVVDGRFYAIGGRGHRGLSAANERFDPAADLWSYALPLPAPRGRVGVAALYGAIIAAGGETPDGATSMTEASSVADVFYVHRKDLFSG